MGSEARRGFAERYKRLHTARLGPGSWVPRRPDRPNLVLELDGDNIEDILGFFLALGEAVNGDGGYFGACLNGLSDCFCGGFGVKLPFTLILRNAAHARRAIDDSLVMWWADHGQADSTSYFELILEVLAEHGATVVLE